VAGESFVIADGAGTAIVAHEWSMRLPGSKIGAFFATIVGAANTLATRFALSHSSTICD
jgi:hypothetical protein